MEAVENEPDLEEDPPERSARVVGLGEVRAQSLESVERRRFHLWIVSAILLVSISLGFAFLSLWPRVPTTRFVDPSILRVAIVLLAVAFCAYAFEKEFQLRRLTKLLWDERVLTTALTGRLHEVSLLLEAGKAMNSMLDLPVVLETILGGATELLDAGSGSIMLREGDELVCTAVQGNDAARDSRIQIGDGGIAGRVAAELEPLLIEGRHAGGPVDRVVPVDSAVSVPLIHRQELLGVLNVNAGPDRLFTEYDLRAMSLFAEQAASAIANARLYSTEQERVAELVELDRMKRDFVATVSHELRTPLTSIVAAAKTAKRTTGSDRDEFWEIVEQQADRLSDTVEDILDAAKLDERTHSAGAFRVPSDLASLARMAVAGPELTGLMVDVEAPDSAVACVDPEAMRRVLNELIDNALRYGAPPIRVVVSKDATRTLLTVLDNGPGVPRHSRDRIFERFSRLDRDRNEPGIGLGLPIVRALVRSSGGEIHVEESPSGGAAFVVALPTNGEVPA